MVENVDFAIATHIVLLFHPQGV